MTTGGESSYSLLSSVLGYAVVAGASGVKLPQVFKLLRAKSVRGISLSSLYLEIIAYTLSTAYNVSQLYPPHTWLESLFLTLQNFLILWCFVLYSTRIDHFGFSLVFLGTLLGVFCFCIFFPPFLQELVFAISTPLALLSRAPQIYANWRSKSTGHLSFLTFFLKFIGTAVRIFTTVTSVHDSLVLSSHVASTALNGVLVAQILLYWSNSDSYSIRSADDFDAYGPASSGTWSPVVQGTQDPSVVVAKLGGKTMLFRRPAAWVVRGTDLARLGMEEEQGVSSFV